jgi:hypothetical protein
LQRGYQREQVVTLPGRPFAPVVPLSDVSR